MIRKVSETFKSRPTVEGAGVRLKRVFGPSHIPLFDPFLLLDDFSSDNPSDYMAGFPWHPHRGIETVTYVLKGKVEHGDSLGNGGIISAGEVQWMTAGSGIIHQEMPLRENGLKGFQLWVNLPKAKKMMDPRYRGVEKDQIRELTLENEAKVRIISGSVEGIKGPVQDIVVPIEYLDVTVPGGAGFEREVNKDYNVFAYVFDGEAQIGNQSVSSGTIVLFGKGDSVSVKAPDEDASFLLVSGKPIGEPVAWGGPIVMNTQKELEQAFRELDEGNFIKNKGREGKVNRNFWSR